MLVKGDTMPAFKTVRFNQGDCKEFYIIKICLKLPQNDPSVIVIYSGVQPILNL